MNLLILIQPDKNGSEIIGRVAECKSGTVIMVKKKGQIRKASPLKGNMQLKDSRLVCPP